MKLFYRYGHAGKRKIEDVVGLRVRESTEKRNCGTGNRGNRVMRVQTENPFRCQVRELVSMAVNIRVCSGDRVPLVLDVISFSDEIEAIHSIPFSGRVRGNLKHTVHLLHNSSLQPEIITCYLSR